MHVLDSFLLSSDLLRDWTRRCGLQDVHVGLGVLSGSSSILACFKLVSVGVLASRACLCCLPQIRVPASRLLLACFKLGHQVMLVVSLGISYSCVPQAGTK